MEFKTSSARSHWSPASRLTHTRNLILDTKNDGLWKGVSQASNFECVFLGCIYVEFQGVSSWSVDIWSSEWSRLPLVTNWPASHAVMAAFQATTCQVDLQDC